jgi:hypothetical protein
MQMTATISNKATKSEKRTKTKIKQNDAKKRRKQW